MFASLFLMNCSNNTTVDDGDLDISEIESIEESGEFAAEDFFDDEQVFESSDSSTSSETSLTVDNSEFDDLGSGELFSEETIIEEGEGFDQFDDFVTAEPIEGGDFNSDFEEPALADNTNVESNVDAFAEFSQESTTYEAPSIDVSTETTEIVPDIALTETESYVDTGSASSMLDSGNTSVSESYSDTSGAASDLLADNSNYTTNTVSTEAYTNNYGGQAASDILFDDSSSISYTSSSMNYSPSRNWVPVKKMKTSPYYRGGQLLNALYIVRPGDSIQGINKKIYGTTSPSFDVLAVNRHIRPDNLKVGQKIYYNSPNRPNDRDQMLFFYDDIRSQASRTTASAGSNLRSFSKELFSHKHKNSWMEIYATNPEIVSKWGLNQDQAIRYWPDSESYQAPARTEPVLAQNTVRPERVNPPKVEVQKMDENSAVQPSQSEETPDPQEAIAKNTENQEIQANAVAQADTQSAEQEAAARKRKLQEELRAKMRQKTRERIAKERRERLEQQRVAGGVKNPFQKASANSKGFLGNPLFQNIALGAFGLLLLLFLLFFVRRRRSRKAQVQEFDFSSNEQTKTKIDI